MDDFAKFAGRVLGGKCGEFVGGTLGASIAASCACPALLPLCVLTGIVSYGYLGGELLEKAVEKLEESF